MAQLFFPVYQNPEIDALHKFRWKLFFQQSGFWAIGGPGHLAMIVTPGGALSELMEQGCLVSSFEPGAVIQLSP